MGNSLYALSTHQEFEASLYGITDMLHLVSYDILVLLDINSTLCDVSPYAVVHFGFGSKSVFDPFVVSTTVGESIIARKIYRNCVMSIFYREELVDLIELNMLDFHVILGMEWVYLCYAILYCRTRRVTLHFLDELVLK